MATASRSTSTSTSTTTTTRVDPPIPASPLRPKRGSHMNGGTASSSHAGGGTSNGDNAGQSSYSSSSNTANHNLPVTPNRSRLNSRDIPRSYEGMYGQGGDDLLPFELARNWHTDWLERGEFFFVYLGGIAVFQLLMIAVMDMGTDTDADSDSDAAGTSRHSDYDYSSVFSSWTVTNATHCLVTIIYLHWSKGSFFDDQGEMAAMTLWEQLEGRPQTIRVKRLLTIAPTLLCYAACQFSNYDYHVCVVNCILWSIHIFAKLPVMNGVRIFGINRTTGIDDYNSEKQE